MINGILIVSAARKVTDALITLLKPYQPSHMGTATSGAQARRLMINNKYDLVVINAPLPDEQGDDLALSIATGNSAGVLLLIKAELVDAIGAKVEEHGVFVMPKPMNLSLFHQSIKLIAISQQRLQTLKNENMRLSNKLEEMRIVSRAKCTLIEHLGITEAQAHRVIEKQAMDMRITRREVAQEILQTYED